jgi:hypothetical protein
MIHPFVGTSAVRSGAITHVRNIVRSQALVQERQARRCKSLPATHGRLD